MSEVKRAAIIGDGAWGTAMALLLHGAGVETGIWGYDPAYLETMANTRENGRFLPGVPIPDGVGFNPDMRDLMAWADMAVVAVPSKFLRKVLSPAAAWLHPSKPVLSLTKGFDDGTLERPSQVVRECLGSRHVAALSGPSHAEEVARGLPASVVVASDELETARRLQKIVSTSRFRAYASWDIIGVEVAGAFKNVIALAAGIVHGLELGDNALSALATRGLAEMTRLGTVLGGDPGTFSGLAGMGDLITTCISPHSRNRRVGVMLAEGKRLDEILAAINGVPESVTVTALAVELAKKHDIDMPITTQVAAVLWEGRIPEEALDELMNRARKDEI